MPEQKLSACLVVTTVGSPEDGARIGRSLVEERLAACVTQIPGVQSIYRWKGAVEESTETLLLIKTGPDQVKALEARLHELHSYETPEFLVLRVDSGSPQYLSWLHACLHTA